MQLAGRKFYRDIPSVFDKNSLRNDCRFHFLDMLLQLEELILTNLIVKKKVDNELK